MQALRARKTADAAVYQWKNQNPAMILLFRQYPWFEELTLTIAGEVLKNAPWGLWWRVISGGGMSMLDLATDIVFIVSSLQDKELAWSGWLMLQMLLASMGLQLVVVVLQNGGVRGGWGRLLKEVLIVESRLKPGERRYSPPSAPPP